MVEQLLKHTKTTDNYVDDVTSDRTNYQLEPATVIKDNYDNVNFLQRLQRTIWANSAYSAQNTDNHSRLNSQETYAWNPKH